ncbi:phage portal protein, HK97 family [Bradyrhizobium brasilense]|uniref:Phage portal protein, HK97 family n=1 Tax=Bradyrhizobium brasilense TaxID=1419277 RepID=A0A1G6IMQ3_9BRAD|nr:phage portal protein [Bradyrhizobium brasilense]SDC07046.1 phage portal protein, HK97 family [Bradyrhizobium brasilense]
MSLFGSIEFKSAGGGLTWGEINDLWATVLGGAYQSKSGPPVGWRTALRVTAFLACTRRIVEAVSTVPTKLFLKPQGGSRTEAYDHAVYELLDSEPNEWQDPLQFKETLAIHCAVTNNAYAFINRVRGKIVELIPIIPTHVQPKWRPDRTPYYLVTAPDGSQAELTPSEILHIRGLSWDGLKGLDAVQLLQEPLGLALATEQTHAMLHAHGARPSGIISVDKNLDEKELIRLAAWVKKHYAGLDNVSRVMILDNDAKFTPFDMKGVDSQHIALRNHEIESICHGMGVLPIVIGYPAEMAARAAAETLVALHLVHTVRPWHRRFEQAFNRQLLSRAERKEGYYTKFMDGEFLRATAKDRAAYNKDALGGGASPGWAMVDEVRGWDELPELPNGAGKHIYAPLNAGPIGDDGVPKSALGAAAPVPPKS